MMRNPKKHSKSGMATRVIFYLILLVILVNSSYAISLGISPSRVAFKEMLRDGYAEREVSLTTNSEDDLSGHFTVSGEIAGWVRFEPNSTTFSASSSSPYRLKIIVQTPNDTKSDSYRGEIKFVTDRKGNLTGRAGGLVKAAVKLNLDVEVTDTERVLCSAGAFSFKDIEEGYPLELSYTIINGGNVRIRPVIRFGIWDQSQEKLVLSDEFTGEEILPTTEKKFTKKIPNKNLDAGQYWVNVAVDECSFGGLLTFSVVEKGAIIDKGALEKITNKLWVYVEEPVEIAAVFKNTGPRIVSAKLIGNVKLEDEIVEVIETEEVDVNSEETIELKHYFTPKTSGRYVVSGRVAYNKKLTYEKGSIINANYRPEEKKRFNMLILIIYLVIVVTIIFILRKIVKKKKGF